MAQISQFCTFYLDNLLFGVELKHVKEVGRPLDITQFPLAPAVVSGLINLRGQVVTAVELRRRLMLEPRPAGATVMNVVVRSADGAVILLVDDIGDVVDVDESTFEPAPEMLSPRMRSMILGIHKLQGRLLHVLDTESACEMADLVEAGALADRPLAGSLGGSAEGRR